MSGLQGQPPAGPVLNGATAGMGGAPGAASGAMNPLQAKFQEVIAGARVILQTLTRIPGVDQAKLQQATQLLGQGMQLIAEAVQQQQKPQ